jgi:uncharacterized membrane protein YccC
VSSGLSRLIVRLRAADPGFAVIKRAVRVGLAGLSGFYVCLYWVGNPITAVYSMFTAIALGGLSTVAGTPSQRTRTFLVAGIIGLGLAAVGTWTAVNDAAAAAGMLIVAIVVTFAGIGGPRVVSVANGLQLFYILACFPPYLPGTISSRLTGIAAGAILLTVADRLLWSDPGPRPFSDLLAEAMDRVGDLAAVMIASASVGAAQVESALIAANAAVEPLRLSSLAPMQRPVSPSARDRGLEHATETLRHVRDQLGVCSRLSGFGDARALATVLQPLAATLHGLAVALRGQGELPSAAAIQAALETFDRERLTVLRSGDERMIAAELRVGARLTLAAGATVASLEACRAALGVSVEPIVAPVTPGFGPFWYAGRSTFSLYRRRIQAHLSRRSVLLQNALRTGAVLAAARLLAGALDLSHGFWVLLATLSLMRTSAADTRATLRPAFIGTLTGALLGGLVITAIGPSRDFYAGATPFVFVLAFAVGPLLGIAWAQGLFSVVVSFIFIQIAPATWHLDAVRLEDVVLGGTIGAVAGLLAWPRGAGGELRRVSGSFLRSSAAAAHATALELIGRTPQAAEAVQVADYQARLWMLLAEASFMQYNSERPDPRMRQRELHDVLQLGRFLLRGGEFLRMRYADPAPEALPGTAMVAAAAGRTEAHAQAFADAIERDVPLPGADSAGGDPIVAEADWLLTRLASGGIDAQVLRVADVEGWLLAAGAAR